jgi:hypothetical protein
LARARRLCGPMSGWVLLKVVIEPGRREPE